MPQEQNLDRKLGLFSVTNIVIANMIGAGIFTTTGLLMQDLQNVWLMLILWLVGGGIALTGAMCYGEVGAHIPKAGGEYSILSDLYNPMIGFLSGWISFIVGFSAPIAASAIGFSEYMIRVFPAIFEYKSLGPEVFKKVYAIGVVAVFSFLHSRGMHFGSILQNILTALKVVLILVLIAVGFTLGAGSWEHFSSTEPLELDFSKWKTIGLSVMWIMFAYSG
ncbi:MAG: amino acid permease, partial [Bacteroidota bacterium]